MFMIGAKTSELQILDLSVENGVSQYCSIRGFKNPTEMVLELLFRVLFRERFCVQKYSISQEWLLL